MRSLAPGRGCCAWHALAALAGLAVGATVGLAATPTLPPSAYVFYDAVTHGDTATVRNMLVDMPSLATLKFKHDVTALHGAALSDEPSIVELLVGRGAYVDARGGKQLVTPLFLAVMQGHARVAEALIARRADVNAPGSILGEAGAEDLRPLHLAAISGRADIADLLIQKGAILVPRASTGDTPADYARKSGCRTVELLLEAYRTLGLVRGRPVAALVLAVSDSDSAAVAQVLERQPALANIGLEGGWSPLHLAASMGSQGVCDALLLHHANPRAQEAATLWTPALRAYNDGHAALCEYLRRFETAAPEPARPTRR